MAKSPSIILRELNQSTYAVTNSDTVLAVVGYATRGPIGKVILNTSYNEFLTNFGPASSTAPWSHLAVKRAFNQGNQVLFYRVADTTTSAMAQPAEIAINNARTASAGYQEFNQTSVISYGSYTTKEVYDFKVAVDGGTARDVYIASPASGDWLLSTIATDINTQLTGTTYAFQEFEAQTAPTVTANNTEYRVKVSVDGTDLMVTGSASDEFSVYVNAGTTISDISNALSSSLQAGTRGYQRFDTATTVADTSVAIGLASASNYDLNVTVDAEASQTISGLVFNTSTTWAQLMVAVESAINAAFTGNITVVMDNETSSLIRFQSTTEGATSAVTISAGTTNDLLAAINAATTQAGTTETAVGGGDGTTASGHFTVEARGDTGRVRVSSLNSSAGAATATSVAITASSVGGNARSLAFAMKDTVRFPAGTGILTMNNGSASVGATATLNTTSGKVRITSDTIGATPTLSQVAVTSGTGADNKHLYATTNGLLSVDTAVNGLDAILAANTDNVLFTSKEKGSDANNISVIKSTRTNPVNSSSIYKFEVYYGTELVETFDYVSLTIADTNFFVSVINADPSNGGSSWISVDYQDNVGIGTITIPDGTYLLGDTTAGVAWSTGDTIGNYDYRVGVDGIPSSGGSSLFVDALSTSGDLGNQELYNYHILITPDNGSELTQNAAITLAETRLDFIYIADPPFGLKYNEVADWHNGAGSHGRSTAINSSYAATYWSWLKDYNSKNSEYVWSPPSVFIAEKYIEVDNNYGPWYAVAGDTRGKIIASDYESSPSQTQRDLLYGDLNAVNPIVNFATKGLEIYGQKTLLRENSALNRINVRRMVIYAKKLIKSAMEGIVFEPNNPDSWARATNLINSILEPIRQNNGLTDYRVTIDSTTTTADVIAQNKMKGIIKLVPVGTIEIVDLTITILNPGATIS